MKKVVEYKTYTNRSDFEVNAQSDLEKFGIVSYANKFLVFLVGFNSAKNAEFGKYFNKVKSNFEKTFSNDNNIPKLPDVNTKSKDELYLAIMIDGTAIDGKYTGNYLFSTFDEIFSALKEGMTVQDLTDYILLEDLWTEHF